MALPGYIFPLSLCHSSILLPFFLLAFFSGFKPLPPLFGCLPVWQLQSTVDTHLSKRVNTRGGYSRAGVEGWGLKRKCCNMYTQRRETQNRRTLSTTRSFPLVIVIVIVSKLRQLICQMPNDNPKSIKSCFRLLPLRRCLQTPLSSCPQAHQPGKLLRFFFGGGGGGNVSMKSASVAKRKLRLSFCLLFFPFPETETKLAVTSNFSYHSQRRSVSHSFTLSQEESVGWGTESVGVGSSLTNFHVAKISQVAVTTHTVAPLHLSPFSNVCLRFNQLPHIWLVGWIDR